MQTDTTKELSRILGIMITDTNMRKKWKELDQTGGVTMRHVQEILQVLLEKQIELEKE